MIKSLNVVKEKDAAIAGRHRGKSVIDSQTIDDAGLWQIAGTETEPGAIPRTVLHHLIE